MRPVERVIIKCKNCGTEFSEYASNYRVFCSRKCYEISKRGIKLTQETRDKMSGHTAWNKGKHGIFSQDAINKMRQAHIGVSPANKGIPMSDEQKKVVSIATRGIKKPPISISAKMRRGRLAANWQGGKTKFTTILRNRDETQIWRSRVFKRDDFTCQFCFQRGGKLNAHHIFKVSKHPDMIWNLGNGITLHEECHKFYHCHLIDRETFMANELFSNGL